MLNVLLFPLFFGTLGDPGTSPDNPIQVSRTAKISWQNGPDKDIWYPEIGICQTGLTQPFMIKKLDGLGISNQPNSLSSARLGPIIELLEPGQYTIMLRLCDLSRNPSVWSKPIYILIERDPPSPPVDLCICHPPLVGDVNENDVIDIGDAIFLLSYLFGGGSVPPGAE